jgi:hypothetical protein
VNEHTGSLGINGHTGHEAVKQMLAGNLQRLQEILQAMAKLPL